MTGACYQAKKNKVFSFSGRSAAHTKILQVSASIDRCEGWKINFPLPAWERVHGELVDQQG
jgi:hypothetical protein